MYDTRLVPAPLLTLAHDTATALGREWEVLGLLQTAILSHRLGFHCSLDIDKDQLRITAFVPTTTDPERPVEPVVTTTAMAQADGTAVADIVRSAVLPHFGRRDAIEALALLSLPLREANIPAIAQGTRERTEIKLQAREGGDPLIAIVMTSPRHGAVHVGLVLERLTAEQAIRCARPAMHEQLPYVEASAAVIASEVHTVLAAFPGLRATPSLAGPRFTIIQTHGSNLKIRHDAAAIAPDAPLALAIPQATVATAYAVLRAYAAN
ncbi:hypothetical protein OG453_07000 [Streptomyces sp. NBC_01381]|uniref:hypothetical protein n=1 Tax=Streptomyces sp. NBC_01381 TaxID=2903845 RepID=UPI002259D739|nr:hypothetical protein [Streptomyces sp. NBC_01381]MCX4666415.1 hypothetical protein [Streptomyces sp. NBC_01381]